ncbi:hypothetical protein SEA_SETTECANDELA_208 [Mycobacterium phage Settecandela]|nr:hypothetical protein SEA_SETTECANDELA_208 [Mycobacterium phage Settecandela]
MSQTLIDNLNGELVNIELADIETLEFIADEYAEHLGHSPLSAAERAEFQADLDEVLAQIEVLTSEEAELTYAERNRR